MTRPATAIEALTALKDRSAPDAQDVLASYLASDTTPRYDTPQQQAEAELEAGL
jgi:hypothetical protein